MVVRSLTPRAQSRGGQARSLCTAAFSALNRGSLRADVRVVDDFAPFGDLRPDARAELVRRIADRRKPQRLQPLLDVGRRDCGGDAGAPALDDAGRCPGRRDDASQRVALEVGNARFSVGAGNAGERLTLSTASARNFPSLTLDMAG